MRPETRNAISTSNFRNSSDNNHNRCPGEMYDFEERFPRNNCNVRLSHQKSMYKILIRNINLYPSSIRPNDRGKIVLRQYPKYRKYALTSNT